MELSTAMLHRDPGSCSCPAFAESGACKHLWATILELELLLGAASKLGGDAPMFARNAEGEVVGWRDARARQLCSSSFEVDAAGEGRGIAFRVDWPAGGRRAAEVGGEATDAGSAEGDAQPWDADSEVGGEEEFEDEELDGDDESFEGEIFDDELLDDAEFFEHEEDVDLGSDDEDGSYQPIDAGRRSRALGDQGPMPGRQGRARHASRPAPKLGWRDRLLELQRTADLERRSPPSSGALTFLIDADAARLQSELRVWVAASKRRADGSAGRWRLQTRPDVQQAARAAPDHRGLAVLAGLDRQFGGWAPEAVRVPPALVDAALGALVGSSVRLVHGIEDRLRLPADLPAELTVEDGPPFDVVVDHRRSADQRRSIVEVVVQRGGERIAAGDVVAVLPGWLLTAHRIVRCALRGADALGRNLLLEGPLDVPAGKESKALATIAPLLGRVPLASAVLPVAADIEPLPVLTLDQPGSGSRVLEARVQFEYAGIDVACDDPRSVLVDRRRLVRRDEGREQAALGRLRALGAQPAPDGGWRFPGAAFGAIAQELLAAGWRIFAEGRPVRRAGRSQLSVRSWADWFGVEAALEFDGAAIPLPALLRARSRAHGLVELGDGTFGLLPEHWLDRWRGLAALGEVDGAAVRVRAQQGWIVDLLLASHAADAVSVDRAFRRRQERLRRFEGIAPQQEPAGFAGSLRGYQREGLGWLHFLREFGFGGCLADDMGLGKTAQVLALLAGRRRGRAGKASLVVAPRSVVFHWREEAARFAPRLVVHEHVGLQRWADLGSEPDPFRGVDIVLTTYGTLVRDIARLHDVEFHTVVLDEANAIKNAQSQRAKAARTLRAEHRLALSGTPIENSLDELWSLFEFLNPGMLGRAAAFRELLAAERGAGASAQAFESSFGERLRGVLRPFFLRRTKQTVLSDLPDKTEQVVRCDLESDQRRDYEQLRDHYRSNLLQKVAVAGLARSKMHVLEALLRLRQLACHRGLIDRRLRAESSAKLEVLLPMLDDVVRGGHKALVFSQFTSFLDIVRACLRAAGLGHEYLDGRTRRRQDVVERFQADPDCKVFLLSLKAGGVGLNLTAADYVFLLDPWWNPAVEAQAIDRTHRIGQTRPVFAYRLIARGTIEEKLLDLQRDKRALAEALFAEGGSPLRDLTAEDLERLLS